MEFEITRSEVNELIDELPLFDLLLEYIETSDEFKLKVVELIDESVVQRA